MRILASTLLLLAIAPAAASQSAVENWALREELRIGSLDGPAALSAPMMLLVSPDGRQVYISQRQENLIRVFDAGSGRLIRTIGRQGDGPGEFMAIGAMGWKQDTLWVTDGSLHRVAMFSAEGRHLRTDRMVAEIAGAHPAAAAALCVDGSIIGRSPPSRGVIAPTILMSRDGGVLRTLAAIDARETWFTMNLPNGRIFTGGRPMAQATRIAIASDGCSIAVVYQPQAQGASGRLWVTRLRPTGDTVYHRSYSYVPRPLSQAMVDSIVAVYAASAGGEGSVSPRVRQIILEALDLPASQPPVSDVVIGSDETVWLRRDDPRTGWINWIILDPAGSHRATLRAPVGLNILASEGRAVWGMVRDEFDVPYVIRYRVVRAP